MNSYTVLLIVMICFPSINAATTCQTCFQQVKLNALNALNTSNALCPLEIKQGDLCVGLLVLDFSHGTASINLDGLAEDALIFSNGNQMSIKSAVIWLSKERATVTLQSICRTSGGCVRDINNTYHAMKGLKHDQLRSQLRQHLFDPQNAVHNLTCLNDQGTVVNCSKGFCQFIASSTGQVSRACIPAGTLTNPYGVLIESHSSEVQNKSVLYSYSCNKQKCNNDETSAKIRNILQDFGFFSVAGGPVAEVTTTPNKSTTSKASAMSFSIDAWMFISWLILRYFY